MQGKIKWFDATKGWGFISQDGKDVFLHWKNVSDRKRGERVAFEESEEVAYDVEETSRGPRAVGVVRLGPWREDAAE